MSTKWFMKTKGGEYGPYTWDQLLGYAREGRVMRDDLVKSEAMSDWVIASHQEGLFEGTSGKAAPPPPPKSQGAAPPAMETKQASAEQMQSNNKRSPLKTLGIILGAIVGIGIIGIIAIIATTPSGPVEVGNVQVSSEINEEEATAINPTDTFDENPDTIYVSTDVYNAPPDSTLSIKWFFLDEDIEFGENTVNIDHIGDSQLYFAHKPDLYWPPGSYRAEISSNESDEILATTEFTVEWSQAVYEIIFPGRQSYFHQDFALAYPPDWTYEELGNKIAFYGIEGTPEYDLTIEIQVITAQYPEDNHKDLDMITAEHILDLESYNGNIIDQSSGLVYEFYNAELPITMFTADYIFDGIQLKEWTALVKGNDDKIIEFIYTAPADSFDNYTHTAAEIFDTLIQF